MIEEDDETNDVQDEESDEEQELTPEQLAAAEEARRQIQEKLAAAARLIQECEDLADKHGICFEQPTTGGYGNYTPDGREGTEETDLDLSWPGEFSGWQASALCYG